MNKKSIFKKNEELENSIIIAIFVSIIWCVGENAPLSFLEAVSLAGLTTILIHVPRGFIYGREKIVALSMQERVYLNGNLDEVLAVLYQTGLRLKARIGEYYIFTTNYILFPSDEFLVREEEGYCVLQSKKVLLNYLREQTDLRNLIFEYRVNNRDITDQRQNNGQSCQATMVIPINPDTKGG